MKDMLVGLMMLVVGVSMADNMLNIDDSLRIQRNLLQNTDMEEEARQTTERTTEKEEEIPIEPSSGPERFYFENGNLPKVLFTVKDGIQLTVFKSGEVWDTFVLDKPASGGMTGSKVSPDSDIFQVDIDWKKQEFTGAKNPDNKIEGLQIEMTFNIKNKNFKLIEIKIVDLKTRNGFVEASLNPWTRKGYDIMAPVGLSFGCYSPGMFGPKGNYSEEATSAGLTFPEWQLQVYKVHRGKFGPLWECGNMLSIGLWVGILVTLGFALVCAWGFTMLANINTMDRFDDPKRPSIYVPNTD